MRTEDTRECPSFQPGRLEAHCRKSLSKNVFFKGRCDKCQQISNQLARPQCFFKKHDRSCPQNICETIVLTQSLIILVGCLQERSASTTETQNDAKLLLHSILIMYNIVFQQHILCTCRIAGHRLLLCSITKKKIEARARTHLES